MKFLYDYTTTCTCMHTGIYMTSEADDFCVGNDFDFDNLDMNIKPCHMTSEDTRSLLCFHLLSV